jgi:hypothetical protein
MCKTDRLTEVDDDSNQTNDQWTISFEQFEAAINTELCLVKWFENNDYDLSLEKHIDNYYQDILRK